MKTDPTTTTANHAGKSGLIRDVRSFILGVVLVVTFLILLVGMFIPMFDGENAMQAADRLFNSISKGSTNFMPELAKKNKAFVGTDFSLALTFPTEDLATKAQKILGPAGASPSGSGKSLSVKGDLGAVLNAAIEDSKAMFNNESGTLEAKYGIPGREALYVWWETLQAFDRGLTREKHFKEATFVAEVRKKGVEVGFNFYGIEPETASSRALHITVALVFYVAYTLWWGIAIMLLCTGFGLQMKAGSKKEM